ncbi:MAG TPA: signal peptidase I, partial [Polyangiaceae bacterium]|nr:signal peptidase I [Polyangiaceae bacterium]
WPLWFVVVPLVLCVLVVWLVKPTQEFTPVTLFERFQWEVRDQQVPAYILFFTVFEMVLYSYRHSLPFVGGTSGPGRNDVPKNMREEFEHAEQLLDEAERILRKNRARVERELPAATRDELRESLEELRDAMAAKPFEPGPFSAAYERASRLVSHRLGPWQKGEFREYVESIAVAVGVALLLRSFVVEAFKIPSGSMLPTLQIQDHIFVNKLAYGPAIPWTNLRLFNSLPPARGDIMVFEYPDPNPNNERQDFIKRVIALQGDTLTVENGHPLINGWRIPNCRIGMYEYHEGTDSQLKRSELYMEFLGSYAYITQYEEDRGSEPHQGPYHVKQGETWVMGDNRNNSSDSRAWNGGRGGGVPDANIKGRAMFVWLSFGPDGGVTWDRLATNVLGKPRLPKGAPVEVLQSIDKCLRERPPPSQTLPPPPTP